MTTFAALRARAEARKGGPEALARLLPPVAGNAALARMPDDRVLAEMAKRIFSSGFVWSVIEQKWPAFEAAFLGFDVARLTFQPDESWERLVADTRIVRHPQKIKAVAANAHFVAEVARSTAASGRCSQAGRARTRSACSRCSPSAARASADGRGSISCASSAGTGSCSRATSSRASGMRRRDRRRADVEKRCPPGAGAPLRLGPGERPADDARVAHLRAVDRRELRRGGTAEPRHGRGALPHDARGRRRRAKPGAAVATPASYLRMPASL